MCSLIGQIPAEQSRAKRISLSIDVAFSIFKVFHNHALFRFRLSPGSDAPCWVPVVEEYKPIITHSISAGCPGIHALSELRLKVVVGPD